MGESPSSHRQTKSNHMKWTSLNRMYAEGNRVKLKNWNWVKRERGRESGIVVEGWIKSFDSCSLRLVLDYLMTTLKTIRIFFFEYYWRPKHGFRMKKSDTSQQKVQFFPFFYTASSITFYDRRVCILRPKNIFKVQYVFHWIAKQYFH